MHGPYWHPKTIKAPLGLPFESPHAVYLCRRCFVVAMCHPRGPLPELDPQSFEQGMKDMREQAALVPTLTADLERAVEHLAHQARVIEAYEEAEQAAPAAPDADALALAVAERVGVLLTPAPPRRKAAA
jgi:hypothetical protein